MFCVTDLLPHLATEQMKRTATEVVRGEDLNIPQRLPAVPGRRRQRNVKLASCSCSRKKYGMEEADFLSAELEAVLRARDVELDRSMIGAHGHGDRAYALIRR